MVNSPCQCLGNSDQICNQFLSSCDNDPHHLCGTCRGKECNIVNRCGDCHGWDDKMWSKVSSYRSKLAIQRERKERKTKAASSSSSFSGFSLSILVPLCELSSSIKSVSVATAPIIIIIIISQTANPN